MLAVYAQSYANSSLSYMSANGYSYTAQNVIITGKNSSDGLKYASAALSVESEQNLPGGYAGVFSIMYDDNDNILVQADYWNYSLSNHSGITRMVNYYRIVGQQPVMSKGLAGIWNGSGYWTYATFATPYLNDYT